MIDWDDDEDRFDADMVDWWHDLLRDRKLMAGEAQGNDETTPDTDSPDNPKPPGGAQ